MTEREIFIKKHQKLGTSVLELSKIMGLNRTIIKRLLGLEQWPTYRRQNPSLNSLIEGLDTRVANVALKKGLLTRSDIFNHYLNKDTFADLGISKGHSKKLEAFCKENDPMFHVPASMVENYEPCEALKMLEWNVGFDRALDRVCEVFQIKTKKELLLQYFGE